MANNCLQHYTTHGRSIPTSLSSPHGLRRRCWSIIQRLDALDDLTRGWWGECVLKLIRNDMHDFLCVYFFLNPAAVGVPSHIPRRSCPLFLLVVRYGLARRGWMGSSISNFPFCVYVFASNVYLHQGSLVIGRLEWQLGSQWTGEGEGLQERGT